MPTLIEQRIGAKPAPCKRLFSGKAIADRALMIDQRAIGWSLSSSNGTP
jgi:hypothetical protein